MKSSEGEVILINISELYLGSIILDLAALAMLIGILAYTNMYRRRGRIEDIGFFRLCIIAIIMSVADIAYYLSEGSTLPQSASICMLSNDVFYIFFEIFCGAVAAYFYHRFRLVRFGTIMATDADSSLKLSTLLIMIPALISAVMVLGNRFGGYLYTVNKDDSLFVYGPLFLLIYVAPAIYVIFSIIFIARIDYTVLWLFILLIVARALMEILLRGISSTSVVFAVGLAFIHAHVMGDPFYDDLVSSGDKEGAR